MNNNDYFDDDELFEEETKEQERRRNLWVLAGFVGLVALVLVLVIAIEVDKDRHKRRTARELGDKVVHYKGEGKTRKPRITQIPKRDQAPAKENFTEKPAPPSIEESQAYLSVVRIIANKKTGSGTLLSRKGYFLTNYHVVAGTTFQLVFFSRNPRNEPRQYFAAKIVFANNQLDIAVLQVVTSYGDASLNDIIPIKIGDSSGLKLGDELYIYGYPGIGGDTITLTRGVISGFLDDQGWIKTDANAASGNSGGGAFNSKSELVGIPTARTSDRHADSQITMIRPINSIKKYILRFF